MISVVIPTFNRKQYLPRSINSILNQTEQNFEIIVIDDGSTDNTRELFETSMVDKRIKYFQFEKNQGVNQARNKGIDLAQGEFITFLDSDDELFDYALEKALKVTAKDKAVGMVSAPYMFKNGELTGFNKTSEGLIEFSELLCGKDLRRKKGGFVMIRKSVFGDLRWNVPYLQFIFFRRIARKCKLYYFPYPFGVYHYLYGDESVSKLRNKPDINLSILRARELMNYIEEFEEEYYKYCPCKLTTYYYGATVGLLLDNKKAKALRYARLMVKYNPRRIKYVVFLLFALLPFSSYLLRGLFRVKKFVIMKNLKK